ncbi:hypothetical protein [Klebsiella phage vB_KpnS-VAC51]|uniref:Uncharacterized protein n=1 Tax=Klebsiella phage vB_KpnS-VAC51 TaxID=2866698 RepID=A0AAE9C6L4_9CAUD|nr:hypothetical protein [Klebsiella phage vB_KpnS-VAC51]
MCKSDNNLFLPPWGWRGLVEVCANPTIIFREKARSLLQRSGGRESGEYVQIRWVFLGRG